MERIDVEFPKDDLIARAQEQIRLEDEAKLKALMVKAIRVQTELQKAVIAYANVIEELNTGKVVPLPVFQIFGGK